MPDESEVRAALWISQLAPTGAGKTPAADKAFAKLRDLDAKAWGEYRTQLELWQAKPAKERENESAPRDETIRIDDATLEAVARWLAGGGDTTGVVETDELSGWLQSIGQYKRVSGDKGRWLAMWSCQPWRSQRVGADKTGGVGIDIFIERPVVTVTGGLQPHLHHLLGEPESGFRACFLPHMATGTVEWGRCDYGPPHGPWCDHHARQHVPEPPRDRPQARAR